MSRDKPTTSPLLRMARVGGLMGRVGASVLGSRIAGLARTDASKQLRQTENLVRNAARIAETLGEMKGAAMKIGQMLSLHEGMMPPEVAEVLRGLQKEAPRVPPDIMELEIRGALKNFDALFESLEPEGFAAASIGQVHRGRLRDGRDVAVKIQYPLIDRIVEADLGNLKRLMKSIFAMFSNADFEPLWEEVRDRLLEELDYTHEAENLRRMQELNADVPEIVVPAVVDVATTKNVLTMEFVDGVGADAACSTRFDQDLRDRWGQVLYGFMMRGILHTRFLHADPNLANFAFLPDGRVVVYDCGCVKRVPESISRGYGELTAAALGNRKEDVPDILLRIGMSLDGAPLPREVTDAYFDVLSVIYREDPPYRFGADDVYREMMQLGLDHMGDAMDMRFSEDIVFVNRTLGGHFGNLYRLEAAGPWRDIASRYLGYS